MALTRTQIKAFVVSNTGKSNKADLVETLCDMALEEAVFRHKFKLANTETDASAFFVADALTTVLPTHVGLAAVNYYETADTDNKGKITIKPKRFMKEHYPYPASNTSEPPMYAYLSGDTLYYQAPADKTYTIVASYNTVPSFATDGTTCPIWTLSNFVAYWVVANVFLSIEDKTNFGVWMNKAVGRDFDNWVGGAFGRAVQADEGHTAIEMSMLDMTYKGRPDILSIDEYDSDGAYQGNAPWYRPN